MSTYQLKGASGAVINQSFTLGARTVIGRADECDLRLDQAGVAPRHVEIIVTDDGLLLRRLDTEAEVTVNGQAAETTELASGDEIRIAACRFVLQAPGLKPSKVLTAEALHPRRSYVPAVAHSSSGMPSLRSTAT
jgi:pSer/pThr/pTyr-binding forkhead associated (FHA) protein